MEKGKETKAQIEKKIKEALVFVPRDRKNYSGVFFSDKGVRLECTDEYCVISTGYHQHVFSAYTSSGYSRPYLHVRRCIEIAHSNDCVVALDDGTKGFSFARLYDSLKDDTAKESEFLVIHYMQMWLSNIFAPLYMIGESELSAFLVFLDYVCFLSSNSILLGEADKDITNREYVKRFTSKVKEIAGSISERVIMRKETEEDVLKENAKAESEDMNELIMNSAIMDETERK